MAACAFIYLYFHQSDRNLICWNATSVTSNTKRERDGKILETDALHIFLYEIK